MLVWSIKENKWIEEKRAEIRPSRLPRNLEERAEEAVSLEKLMRETLELAMKALS